MTEKVDFTGVRSTMLVTLYLKAAESRSADSILGDHIAAEVVDRIDCDFAKLIPRGGAGNRFTVALRARQPDEWATAFLRRHADAVVLHLGCGLDSRAFRLDLPIGVRWFDVDLPDVIDVRRRLYPEPDGYHMVGAAVTDPGWLDRIPTGYPVLVIAEGLLMYLTESAVKELLDRLTHRFSTGELLFDGFAGWVVRTSQRLSKLMARKGFPPLVTATRDGREMTGLNPQFRHVANVPMIAQFARIPVRGYRMAYRLMNMTAATRTYYQVFRVEF